MKPFVIGGLAGFVLLTCSSPLGAQDPEAPAENLVVHRNIEYTSVHGIPLQLDLYLPRAAAKPVPVILWVHGGSWWEGDKSNPPILPMTRFGFAVASIDYRLSQQALFPAQLDDCKAAVRWLRAHAAEYGLNPDKIGAAGASAGGHLVALLGTTADHPELEGNEGNPGVSSRVQAVCDYFGPTDFINWNKGNLHPVNAETDDDPVARLIGGRVVDNEAKARAASPITYVTPQASPFFIVHGDQDTVVPLAQSIELNEALQKAGVPSSLWVVKGAGHGFTNAEAFQKAVDFFRRYLQTPDKTGR